MFVCLPFRQRDLTVDSYDKRLAATHTIVSSREIHLLLINYREIPCPIRSILVKNSSLSFKTQLSLFHFKNFDLICNLVIMPFLDRNFALFLIWKK